MKIFSLLAAAACAATTARGDTTVKTYSATVLVDTTTTLCTLVRPTGETQLHRAIKSPTDIVEQTKVRQNRFPEELLAGEQYGLQQFVEVIGGSVAAVDARVAERCVNGVRADTPADGVDKVPARSLLRGTQRSLADDSDIVKIVDSGDPLNRIDVVFMGDGYTLAERARFFEDIRRLTNDMFTGDTFAQYLPLFNVWAAYVPSVESGIGVGGTPRNTAFQLYRDGTTLRGVFTRNPQAARTLCASLGTASCDFPSLIGNDDFYGGLGGEFVISTRSPSTGTMVLRHEMGHNFGNVGEEYDGGSVYRGANAAKSLDTITWKHWLTDPTRLVEEKSAQLFQRHIWYDLKQGAYTINFNSTGAYKRWYMQFSVSGTDTDDSLSVTLDGQPLAWKSNGLKDRSFYQWSSSTSGFSAGQHTLVVQAGGSFDSPIIKQLCNAVIYEYADESEFKMDDREYIGIYPTYDINKVKTVRPDNELCVMRNMSSTTFCRVCQENMWHQFMARIEFIDSVNVTGSTASLNLIPLGQLRLPTDTFIKANPAVALAEKYLVTWLRNDTGEEVVAFKDQFSATLPKGEYTVLVTFTTPNVRRDPNGFMKSEKTFVITEETTPEPTTVTPEPTTVTPEPTTATPVPATTAPGTETPAPVTTSPPVGVCGDASV